MYNSNPLSPPLQLGSSQQVSQYTMSNTKSTLVHAHNEPIASRTRSQFNNKANLTQQVTAKKILQSIITVFAITRTKHSVISNNVIDPEIGNMLEH